MTPQFKDRHKLLHEIDLRGYRFPTCSDDRASARPPLRFRTPDIMHVVVIEAAGRLDDFVEIMGPGSHTNIGGPPVGRSTRPAAASVICLLA
jgi:hypothetical protein